MKVALFISLTFATCITFANVNSAVIPTLGHPLIGKWKWTRSVNNCTEIYDYRPDGTAPVTSGAERTDNTFSIADIPDPNGFYRMTFKTTKDYGGKDCGDDESDSTGAQSINYIFFKPDQNEYIACMEPNFKKCFGPLFRMRE